MDILKFTLILLLFLSDALIFHAVKKYVISSGDPKYAEQAKKELQWGLGINLFSTLSLIGIHLSEGIDFATYTSFEWTLLSIFGGCMLIVLMTGLLYSLYKKKTELFELVCISFGLISFILGFFSFHLFLNFIQF